MNRSATGLWIERSYAPHLGEKPRPKKRLIELPKPINPVSQRYLQYSDEKAARAVERMVEAKLKFVRERKGERAAATVNPITQEPNLKRGAHIAATAPRAATLFAEDPVAAECAIIRSYPSHQVSTALNHLRFNPVTNVYVEKDVHENVMRMEALRQQRRIDRALKRERPYNPISNENKPDHESSVYGIDSTSPKPHRPRINGSLLSPGVTSALVLPSLSPPSPGSSSSLDSTLDSSFFSPPIHMSNSPVGVRRVETRRRSTPDILCPSPLPERRAFSLSPLSMDRSDQASTSTESGYFTLSRSPQSNASRANYNILHHTNNPVTPPSSVRSSKRTQSSASYNIISNKD